MIMNGSQLESGSFQLDNFPIGLVILSIDSKSDIFTLISINKFAMKLLNFTSTSSQDILIDFIKATKSFKQYFFDMCSLKSLYDSLLHLKRSTNQATCQYSNFVLNGEIISVKMKRQEYEIFITIDDFTEEKKLIRKKLIASIKKNFLMTINHELKNYLCGLITTLEETKSKIDIKDFTTITATVLLIHKIIKLYTLFTKVSFDEIRCITLKLEENMDLYLVALRAQRKFKDIFLYKNISMCSVEPFKKIFIKTDRVYIKNLMFVLFLYLYYKVSDNAVIEMQTEYPTPTSCKVTYHIENNNYSSLNMKEVTFEDEIKMNEIQVKKSVMTVDILKYLLGEICKNLNISIEIVQPTLYARMRTLTKGVNQKKLIILTFNDIEINEDATYKNVDRDLDDMKKQKEKGNRMEFIQNHITFSNPNYSLIEFPFEKKNSYEQLRYLNNTVSNTKKSLKNVIAMTKVDPGKNNNIKDNMTTTDGSSNYVINNYEKVISAFRENVIDLNIDNSNNNNINNKEKDKNNMFNYKEFNAMKSAKFIRDNSKFPLINVDFSSEFDDDEEYEDNTNNNNNNTIKLNEEDKTNQNQTNFNNNDSFNTDEDEISSIHNTHIITKSHSNIHPHPHPNRNTNNNLHPNYKANPTKFLRSKKSANSLGVHHPFSQEETTTIYSGSIAQKISHLVSSEDSIKKILDDITEDIALNDNAAVCNCECKDIAVVDDESAIARSIMKILHNQNYEADYCKDGKDCIEKILSKLICSCPKRNYKLILLDVYMVDWGGIATCQKLNELITNKTIPPTINVIFISGHKLKDLDLPNYQFIKGFYQKPVNKSTIIKILQQYYY